MLKNSHIAAEVTSLDIYPINSKKWICSCVWDSWTKPQCKIADLNLISSQQRCRRSEQEGVKQTTGAERSYKQPADSGEGEVVMVMVQKLLREETVCIFLRSRLRWMAFVTVTQWDRKQSPECKILGVCVHHRDKNCVFSESFVRIYSAVCLIIVTFHLKEKTFSCILKLNSERISLIWNMMTKICTIQKPFWK